MTASFEFNCCSYLYELQSWQPDYHYTTLVPKTKAAAALTKFNTNSICQAFPWPCFIYVCNVNVENMGRPGYKGTA